MMLFDKVVINGQPEVGKDTIVDMCIEELKAYDKTACKISSVDAVKLAAITLGWDGVKDAKGRAFLSNLKDMSTALYDGPMRYMEERCRVENRDVSFFFIREPEEIEKFVKRFPNTLTVLVKRGFVKETSCHSDERVFQYTYDCQLNNAYDLDILKKQVKTFVLLNIMQGKSLNL